MNLKSIIISSAVLTSGMICSAAPVAPVFSDDANEHWYYLVFECGKTVVADQGAKMPVITRVADSSKKNQLWKFVGNENEFILVNKDEGNVAVVNANANGSYFVKMSATPSEAAKFKLVASDRADMADCWEIEYPGKGDEYNRWNQWGGSGVKKSIGLYTSGEANNYLTFMAEADLPKTTTLTKIKEYSVKPMASYVPEKRHTFWYTAPATSSTVSDPWMEYGLPIGNGEFGAMVFGGIAQDRLQFNDKSLWTGSSTIRGSYQTFGDLYIEDISEVFGNTDDKAVQEYMRNLVLPDGVANVSYMSPDKKVKYSREYLASNPDKTVAVRLSASEPGKISVRLRLFNGVNQGVIAPTYKDGEISCGGRLDVLNFKVNVKPVVTGGTVITKEDCIEITGADEVMILLAGATNFDQHSPTYLSNVDAMHSEVDARIASAASKGWEAIYADHIADFSQFYNRAEFNLSNAENNKCTDQLVIDYNKTPYNPLDPSNLMLEELYYAFGRYLLISSSRGMDLPANLQGIWNHTNDPAWQCDIHSNINVQMNYWPAEITNLSEMHMPYLNYVYAMAMEHPQWQEYARRSGQSEGWTCFTQNNIFGHSDYAENYVIANAWYSTHLWQHYAYTLDKEFLKEKAMPVMVSCVKFWLERLVKAEDGTWVAPKEWSPEHGPGEEDGTAHAQQILSELFKNTLAAIDALGDEADVTPAFVSELKEKYSHLDKGLAIESFTGAKGWTANGLAVGDPLLREWKTSTYDVGENGHRHQSHLMAMYPFGDITPESEWFVPAVNSLQQRGDVSTGWSLAWRIALWGRALNGEHAHAIIKSAMRHASSYGQSNSAGGIYYNLLDSHAPFQIDGNFGYTAGVTEMLLQSHGGVIRFLPALPSIWEAGSLKGVKGEGNFEIDQEWNQRGLLYATVKSGSGQDCHLNYKNIANALITDAHGNKVSFEKIDDNNIKFSTVPDGVYNIDIVENSGIAEIEFDENAPVEYYNLQGVRVANPENGIYIVKQGAKATKQLLK